MATLQEFIADAKVASQRDKKAYYQSLLSEVFQTAQVSFINTAFEFGRAGVDGELEENFVRLTFGFTLNDNSWFFKRKFN